MPESTQVDHLFREAATPVFGPFVKEIPILLFEYEYETNQWYELPATIMPDAGNNFLRRVILVRLHFGPSRSTRWQNWQIPGRKRLKESLKRC